jgi:hypothetical protein
MAIRIVDFIMIAVFLLQTNGKLNTNVMIDVYL